MTVNASDLGTYLGMDLAADDSRATLLLGLAVQLCEGIVNPLPNGSDVVILDVAARAYTNPARVQQETVGPLSTSYGPGSGGLWLTRANKATLRLLAGKGGAFSIDTLPAGVNAVQTVTLSATAGTYALTFNGQTTAPLAYNATSGQMQAALEALGSIGAGNVSVTGAGPFVVTFIEQIGTTPVPTMSVDESALTGSASVATTTHGVRAPGQGLPYWDFDYYNSGGSSLPIG